MGEGKPNGEARANVPQETINDQGQWNTGTPKDPGDAVTQGIYPDASDANADAGAGTSQAQQVSMTTDPRPVEQGGNGNPSTYGSMKEGLPASGAATDPSKTTPGDESA
ncbi:hypothetical protein [Deinococcus fonticola]|uniref:hypothetical protein n=1 Tax=Deinococcus fonticola TaxID=2528713 RepID=UPI001074AFEE|nr:hypothetical protein [Deinococcus fonticola]